MKAFAAACVGMTSGMLWRGMAMNQPSEPVDCAALVKKDMPEPPLVPTEFRKLTLLNVYDESPDSKVMRFAFPDGNQDCPGELTHCFALRFIDKDGKEVIRPYTPISRLHNKGYVEFLVKNYKDSKMGSHLFNLKLGDSIEMKGPFPKFVYKSGQYKYYGMLAAGSGITPVFQFLREMLKDKAQPEVSLIYANRRKEDVLLGNELNALMEVHRHFSPYYVLSDPPQSWMGGIGHVSKEMMKAFLPPPSKGHEVMIMVCGPPRFMEAISGDKNFTTTPPSQGDLKGLLKELGYSSNQVFKF